MRFISEELKEKLENTIKYLDEKHKIYIEGFEYENGSFDLEEDDDITIIDEAYELSVYLDESESELQISVSNFIDLIEESKNAKIIDNYKCLSQKRVLIKIEGITYDDTMFLETLLNNPIYKIPSIESNIDGNKITCSITSGVTIFGVVTNYNRNYSYMYPSVSDDDKFIEIYFHDNQLTNTQIDIIFNAFLFELSATLGINVRVDYRYDLTQNINESEAWNYPPSRIRPLIYGEGINELLELFNDATRHCENFNYSIIQYTKIIEYVSQTVINEDITQKAMKKLSSSKSLQPDANFIKELENLFLDNQYTYSKDKNAIKITLEKCCDLHEVFDLAPKYLKKIHSYKDNITKPKFNIEDGRTKAFEELCEAVSNTRNALSHAKANYTTKGNECPAKYKEEYMMMMRLIAIQVIRWYSNLSEPNRIK